MTTESKELQHLLEANRQWSEDQRARDPEYFARLAGQQTPEYMWIGCADSRVPANMVMGLEPGEVFVHRNVANLIKDSDMNCLSVMQFAVDVLRVRHVIVCGHYGCGGVHAALTGSRMGLVDNWLGQLRRTASRYGSQLNAIPEMSDRLDRLCELNVIEQVRNASETTIVLDAWRRGQPLTVHGWAYGLRDGLVHELDISVSSPEELADKFPEAVRE